MTTRSGAGGDQPDPGLTAIISERRQLINLTYRLLGSLAEAEDAHAVLYPAIAEAARRAGAKAVGRIDIGRSAGLNLNVDRVGVTYANGPSLGDPSSRVQVSSRIAQRRPVPSEAIPEVVARIGVGLDPLDVTDADDARWLRACLPPDQPERLARLNAEMTLAATAPPSVRRGDPVDPLPGAIAQVPEHALPVVTTTWALRNSRDRPASVSDAASTTLQPARRWRGYQPKGSGSRRRSRRSATAPRRATASSAWRCSAGPLNPPKPSAAAGRGATSWRGWQTPRHGGSSGCHRIRPEVARCVRAVA